ncbi:putative two-component membrane permease complex subunit [mine drainage metagenome]|uniref:Putative two-component membrane permease complex subunit n=1 Tax=mine drainage metagenome TaxID=410659 RepID=A0A1J5QYU8_9ZZZZ
MFVIFTHLADWLVFTQLGLAHGTKFSDALHFFVEDVSKIFVLLTVIIFVVGMLRTLMTPERLRHALAGRRRGPAYGLAGLLGAVTPFCSCSAVPLFIGLLEAGVPMGVTMTFLITSPMVNEVAVVMLLALLGWKLTALYFGTGMVVGIVGGLLIDALGLERYVEDYVWKIRMGQVAELAADLSLKGRMAYGWLQVREILGRVWLYVLIGIGVGAGLHGYVPADFFLRHAGPDNPFAVPLAVLAGVPLYSNAAGMIPIVEALLGKGLPVGTVLALMMSVTALSLPEMMILRKVLKLPMLAFFAAYLAIAFMVVGYLFNFILG